MAEETMKPPGHSLLEKMAAHTGELLEGVSSELPMVELEPLKDDIKSYCGMCHKGMTDMIAKHGKGYEGLAAPEWPDKLPKPTEKTKGDANSSDADEDDLSELEDEDAGESTDQTDDEMTEDEEKAFEEQISKLEVYTARKEKELAVEAAR